MTRWGRTVGPAGGRPRRAARLGVALTAVTGVLLAPTACASTPSYRYVASDDRSLVLKLPAGWAQVDPAAVGYTSTSSAWRAYFDGSGKPDPADFVSTDAPLTAPSSPVIKVASFAIPAGSRVGLGDLQNAFLPTSQHEVQKLANQAWLNDVSLPAFVKLSQTVVTTSTSDGIRVVTGYVVNDAQIIVDKIAVTDKNHSHIHVIQAWCTQACYTANRNRIDQVFATFTVKRP